MVLLGRVMSKANRKKFSLIELLIVIAIIAILMTLIQPNLRNTLRLANQAVCLNNQRQVLLAAQTYASDNKDILPPMQSSATNWVTNRTGFGGWYDLRPMWEEYAEPKVFYCPSAEGVVVPNLDNYETWEHPNSNRLRGWRLSSDPQNSQGDYYTITNFSIFAGYIRHHLPKGAPVNYLFGPDEEISDKWYADKGRSAPKLDNQTLKGLLNPSEVPYCADYSGTKYRNSLEETNALPFEIGVAHSYQDPYISVHGHLDSGGGMNVMFLDGHGVWRDRNQVAPRLNHPVGFGTYNNSPMNYLMNYDFILFY